VPVISNKYFVNIKNNFAEIKSVQTYRNPFKRALEIHYSIPTDPNFCIARVVAVYDALTVEGVVQERKKVKAEYKEAKEKGSTVMMAVTSASEKSVLKVRLGNLQPGENVRIEFDLLGKLTSELPDKWTLRIPSHISPRYQTQLDLTTTLLKKLLLAQPSLCKSYVLANTDMDFKINLFSSKKILNAHSSSHKLDETVFTDLFRSYSLQGGAVPPERDLEFSFEQADFARPICTLGQQCVNLTFFPKKSTKSNFDNYRGEYIFLLDRSGSMGGDRIKQAKDSLILFLKSLPEASLFNVISFGSEFKRMFKVSVPYTDEHLEEAV
jgi:hypothetical protein